MLNNKTDDIILEYDKILQDGYVIEESSKGNGAFSAQYRKAGELVSQAISHMQTLKKNCYSSYVVNRCWDAQQRDLHLESNNIVAFIGSRGTGKSSAMFSFLNSLCRLDRCDEANYKPSFLKLYNNVEFITLRYINASELNYADNVIEMILARMLNYLMCEAQNGSSQSSYVRSQEKLRELYQKFDELFKHIRALNAAKIEPIEEGESALCVLRDLSSSHSIKMEFQELVNAYLDFFSKNSYDSKEFYLVITIDDLDLYYSQTYKGNDSRDPYMLLEQIQNYLKICGIIVLVAYNEFYLLNACQEHIKRLRGYKNKNQLVEDMDSRNEAQQFLQKLFPVHTHVYMPDFEYADTVGNTRLLLHVNEKLQSLLGEKDIMSSKELVFRILMQRTGVLFDAVGQKKHFFEVRNLRELHEFLSFLHCLEDTADSLTYMHQKNCLKMLDYLYYNFSIKKLTGAELNLFQQWSAYRLSRRSREILNFISNENKSNVSLPPYSYGELLKGLHYATRTYKADGSTILSKQMVHCILATYSFSLNQLYENCFYSKENEQDAYKELKDVIGVSITGSWANEMIPQVLTSSKSVVPIGDLHVSNLKAVWSIQIPELDLEKIYFEESFSKFVQVVEWSGMFFTQIKDDHFSNNLRLEIQNSDNKLFCCAANKTQAQFNIFNFIVNSFTWMEYFDQIDAALESCLIEHLKDEKKSLFFDRKSTKKIYHTLIEKYSLRKKYSQWSKKYNSFAIPLQDFDMTYNVLKRLAKKESVDMPHAISVDLKDNDRASAFALVTSYEKLLNRLKALLEEQGNQYLGISQDNSLVKAFTECPFVKEFKNEYKNADINNTKVSYYNLLIDLLNNIALANPSSIRAISLK